MLQAQRERSELKGALASTEGELRATKVEADHELRRLQEKVSFYIMWLLALKAKGPRAHFRSLITGGFCLIGFSLWMCVYCIIAYRFTL